jgi:hydroxymethylpyrimidine/phosphomethylpyrimidine kinase
MKLNQVTMPMVDYAASLTFYQALGLRLIVASPPSYARFECPAADGGEPATLSIEHAEGYGGGDWPEVFLEVDDLDAIVARLRALGLVVSDPVAQSWLWRECDLRDPAGTRVKLYQAGRNRRFPPWRLGA